MIKKFIMSVLIQLIKNNSDVRAVILDSIVKPFVDEHFKKLDNDVEQLKSLDNKVEQLKSYIQATKIEINDDLNDKFDDVLDAINISLTNAVLQSKTLKEYQQKLRALEVLVITQSKNKNGNTLQYKELDDKIKKVRADAATVIKIVKDDVADLDIRLDAFIDTISEKIAELK